MHNLLRVARVQLKKILSPPRHSFYLGSGRDENCGFVISATDDNPGYLIGEGLRAFITLDEFSFFVLPVLQSF